MSRIEELRSQAKKKREEFEKKTELMKSKATEILNSEQTMLTLMNHAATMGTADDKAVEAVSDRVVNSIIDGLSNPVLIFNDTMNNRKVSPHKREVIIEKINDLFHLTESEDPQEKLEAVALYMYQHEYMWNDIDTW